MGANEYKRGDFRIVGVRYWRLLTFDHVTAAIGPTGFAAMSEREKGAALKSCADALKARLTASLKDLFDDAKVEVDIDTFDMIVTPAFWAEVEHQPFAAVLGNKDKEWRSSSESGYAEAVLQEAIEILDALQDAPATWLPSEKHANRRGR